jgi:hypothetical protein
VYRRFIIAVGAFIALGVMVAGGLLAQSPAASWVSLDGSKAGTPAEVVFDKENSNAATSSFSLVLHGFWSERKDGPGGPYTKITVPGLGSVQQRGAPSLPALRLTLAVPTNATAIKLRSAGASETRTYAGVLIWPNPIPETDQEGSKPEQFVIDEQIYKQTSNYPGVSAGAVDSVRPKLGSINGGSVEAYPFQWNPSTRTLVVHRVTKYSFDHSGTPVTQREMTKDRGAFAAQKFANWESVAVNFPINWYFYDANFLFIYPQGFKDELQPLIDQKKARGFWVTEMTTATTGNTCSSIRTAINNWYNSKPSWTDKYALLVGDVNEIPLCSYGGTPTDDLYASTNGDDLDEEIYLGRLSIDSETDAANQVGKILAYEDNPALFCCYEEALLIAHKEGAPGKYVGAHESVRTASYAVPPTFSTLYGNDAAVTDSDVSAAINAGLGLVAYRGHGSSAAWTTWNTGGESYNSTDVTGLLNTIPRVPVVWGFACTNGDLNVSDSIAEIWMESTSNRAVSYYGATIPSYTSQNHELDRRMFKAVYDLGLTTQSHAIEYAEDQMSAIVGSDNAWMYLLLGDPDMQIRRRNPQTLVIKIPEYINICKGPGCFLDVSVLDKIGNPVQGARVSVWKEGKFEDEVLTNRYTDRSGNASLQVNASTTGTLYYSVKDELGNTTVGKIQVR